MAAGIFWKKIHYKYLNEKKTRITITTLQELHVNIYLKIHRYVNREYVGRKLGIAKQSYDPTYDNKGIDGTAHREGPEKSILM